MQVAGALWRITIAFFGLFWLPVKVFGSSAPAALLMLQKSKILIVDDERAIADTLAVILKQSGFETYATYSGNSAVQLAVEIMPDLVLSDVMMPDKDGIEVAKEIRKKIPGCKILLFSGSASAADLLRKAGQENDWEILAKPVHPKDLLVRLNDFAA